jgi:hypothetical protein
LINNKTKVVFVSIGIVGILALSFFSVPKLYKTYPDSLLKYEYYGDEKTNQAYDYIAQNVNIHNQIAVFGIWDYYNSLKVSTIKWKIMVEREMNFNDAIDKRKKAIHYFSQLLKKRDKNSYSDFIHFLDNKDVKVKEYHLLSFMKILDEARYQNYRSQIEINPFSDKIKDLDSLDEDITCLIIVRKDSEKEINLYADQFMSKQMKWEEIKSQRFFDLGITVTIYERRPKSTTI